jgi:hypothetical protein
MLVIAIDITLIQFVWLGYLQSFTFVRTAGQFSEL